MRTQDLYGRRGVQLLLGSCFILAVVLPLWPAQAVLTARAASGTKTQAPPAVQLVLKDEQTVLRATVDDELAAALSVGSTSTVRAAEAEGLPAGVRLEPQTLRLVGRPTEVGIHQVRLHVTDQHGTMQTRQYLLQVGVPSGDTSGQSRPTLSTAPDAYKSRMGKLLRVAAPGVLANDVGLEPGVPYTLTLESTPRYGDVALAQDGSFTYLHKVRIIRSKAIDTFDYRLSVGTQSVTGTVTIRLER